MRTCRFCEEVIGEQDEVCGSCGYNPKTDTMTASFVKKKKAASRKNQKMLSSGVRSFVFWGIIVIVFSLGVKYQSKAGDIIWRVKNIFLGNKVNKSAQVSGKAKQNKAIGLIDVRSYKAPIDKALGKNGKIEGIFYDPVDKSYVVINGQLISEGMSFGGVVIKKINSTSVEVVRDGQVKVLRVNNKLE